MPRATITGDRVRITGFRNFAYRSQDDFTPRYETREVSLSHLTGVDFYISYWMEGPIGHTFVSFVFDDAPPVCISIEARPDPGIAAALNATSRVSDLVRPLALPERADACATCRCLRT
jgi:Domain of unknown function (DUF4105)